MTFSRKSAKIFTVVRPWHERESTPRDLLSDNSDRFTALFIRKEFYFMTDTNVENLNNAAAPEIEVSVAESLNAEVKISVIVPIYNACKHLRPALDSILTQTFKEIEIICVDDGSTDTSLDMLKIYQKMDNRIRIITETNAGPGHARNNGLKRARGKYVAFLDADDFFEPEMLEKLYNLAEENDLDIAITRYDIYDNKKGKFTPQEREIMTLHSELGYELLKDKGLSEKTLNLIKYHHQDLKGSGYPAKVNNDVYDINTEILTTADKFCALREKRCYKNPLAKFEALEIIAKDVNDGKLSQEVYTALIKSV